MLTRIQKMQIQIQTITTLKQCKVTKYKIVRSYRLGLHKEQTAEQRLMGLNTELWHSFILQQSFNTCFFRENRWIVKHTPHHHTQTWYQLHLYITFTFTPCHFSFSSLWNDRPRAAFIRLARNNKLQVTIINTKRTCIHNGIGCWWALACLTYRWIPTTIAALAFQFKFYFTSFHFISHKNIQIQQHKNSEQETQGSTRQRCLHLQIKNKSTK